MHANVYLIYSEKYSCEMKNNAQSASHCQKIYLNSIKINEWNGWQYTLTGHFIRYTLLVLGWTPFSFRTALILRGIDSTRCWKHSSEILVHIVMIASHSCCRFVVCTSMMWISRSTTSQRCSIGLRSGDCGGHLSKVNSLSCSRNQSEMIWSLWRCIILLEVHQKMVHCRHKGMDMVSNNTQVDCGV